MNEDLIYRITRAVYEQLGASADESIVEKLVTNVYRAIEPTLDVEQSATLRSGLNTSSHPPPAPRREPVGRGIAQNAGESFSHDEMNRDAASRMVISVFGVDRPGIVAAVAQILAAAECSIVDINQTVVGGKFAMVLIADITRARESVINLKERFRNEGERLGVRIYAQREDLFNQMHRV